MIGFRNGREASASLTLQLFFLLGNQDVRVFRLKDWLILLGAVSYMVCGRICSSIVKESVEKSLVGHLFNDGIRMEEGADAHRPEFRPESMVLYRCLGLFWALIRLGLLCGDIGSKLMVPIMAPFFRLGSSFFLGWKNIVFFIFYFLFILAIIGNGEPLMLACSNAHVSKEYTISVVAFSTTF